MSNIFSNVGAALKGFYPPNVQQAGTNTKPQWGAVGGSYGSTQGVYPTTAAPQPTFRLSALGTVVVSSVYQDQATPQQSRYAYVLVVNKDETRLACADLNMSQVLQWKTPKRMLRDLSEMDYLNRDWMEFKAQAIAWIVGKYGGKR